MLKLDDANIVLYITFCTMLEVDDELIKVFNVLLIAIAEEFAEFTRILGINLITLDVTNVAPIRVFKVDFVKL